MARSTVTASRERQATQQTPITQPDLQVSAQINPRPTVNSAASDNWNSLKNTLLFGAQQYGGFTQDVARFAPGWEKQGEADQVAGKVDQSQNESNLAYANGVTHAAAVTHVSAALKDAQMEADEKIDRTAPLDDQMQQYDGIVQKHIGPLVSDPVARQAAAPLVQNSYELFGGQRGQALVGQHQQEAADALSAQVAVAVQGGNMDMGKVIDQASPVLGRSTAFKTAVDRIAQIAEENHDPTILGLIPKTYVNADGVEVQSPINSVENQARIELAHRKIDEWQKQMGKPAIEWAKADALQPFEDRIKNALPIAYTELRPLVEKGFITGDGAWGLVNRADAAIKEAGQKDKKWNDALMVLQSTGSKSFSDIVGMTGGPASAGEASEFNSRYMTWMLKQQNGGTELTGPQIATNPQMLQKALQLSTMTRSPMLELKGAINSIPPSDGTSLLRGLDAYRAIKAAGQTGMYYDDKSAPLYEAALTLKDMHVPDEDIGRAMDRLNDSTAKESVQQARTTVQQLVQTQKFDTQGKWFDQSIINMDGPSSQYAKQSITNMANTMVALGVAPDAAVTAATDRFKSTNTSIHVNGKNVLVPTNGGDATTLKDSLEWFGKAVPDAAKARGLDPEQASLQYIPGAAGKGPSVYVVDGHGIPIGPALSVETITSQYLKAKGESARDDQMNEARKGNDERATQRAHYTSENLSYKTI